PSYQGRARTRTDGGARRNGTATEPRGVVQARGGERGNRDCRRTCSRRRRGAHATSEGKRAITGARLGRIRGGVVVGDVPAEVPGREPEVHLHDERGEC